MIVDRMRMKESEVRGVEIVTASVVYRRNNAACESTRNYTSSKPRGALSKRSLS